MKISHILMGGEFLFHGVVYRRIGGYLEQSDHFYPVMRLPSIQDGDLVKRQPHHVVVQAQPTGRFFLANRAIQVDPVDPPAVSDEEMQQAMDPLSERYLHVDLAKEPDHSAKIMYLNPSMEEHHPDCRCIACQPMEAKTPVIIPHTDDCGCESCRKAADEHTRWLKTCEQDEDRQAPSLLSTVPKVARAILGTRIELPRLLFEAGTVQCSTCRTWKDFRDYDQGTTMCPQCQKGE